MNTAFVWLIIKRFVKASLSGGLAEVGLQLAQHPSLVTLTDWKVWLSTLAVAFLAGTIMAAEKWVQGWQPQ